MNWFRTKKVTTFPNLEDFDDIFNSPFFEKRRQNDFITITGDKKALIRKNDIVMLAENGKDVTIYLKGGYYLTVTASFEALEKAWKS